MRVNYPGLPLQFLGRAMRAESGKTSCEVVPIYPESPRDRRSLGAALCRKSRYEAFLAELNPATKENFYGAAAALMANPSDLIDLSQKLYLMSLNTVAQNKLAKNPQAKRSVDFHRMVLEQSGLLSHTLCTEATESNNPLAAREYIELLVANKVSTPNLLEEFGAIWLTKYPTNIGFDGRGIPDQVIAQMKERGAYISCLEKALLEENLGSHESLVNALVDQDLESAEAASFERIKELLKPQTTALGTTRKIQVEICSAKLAQYINKFGMADISKAREKLATAYTSENRDALIEVLKYWNLNGQFTEQIESLEKKISSEERLQKANQQLPFQIATIKTQN